MWTRCSTLEMHCNMKCPSLIISQSHFTWWYNTEITNNCHLCISKIIHNRARIQGEHRRHVPWLWEGREHSVNAPSQWEVTLHCNIISHWLGHRQNDPRRDDIFHYDIELSNLYKFEFVALTGVTMSPPLLSKCWITTDNFEADVL